LTCGELDRSFGGVDVNTTTRAENTSTNNLIPSAIKRKATNRNITSPEDHDRMALLTFVLPTRCPDSCAPLASQVLAIPSDSDITKLSRRPNPILMVNGGCVTLCLCVTSSKLVPILQSIPQRSYANGPFLPPKTSVYNT
jgi:hypothetical protein